MSSNFFLSRRAIEHFVRKQKEIINITKDDGYMPLHLAALNDHLDVVSALAEMVSVFCNNLLALAFANIDLYTKIKL